MWQNNVTNLFGLMFDDYYGTIEYNPELMNLVRQQTASTTKPLLYIYGGDDFWTGAHIEDEYVNGDNVRYYILPEQNHGACINKMTDKEKQSEIWAFLDAVFKNNPDAIEQIEQPAADAKTRYNLMGQPTDKAQGLSIENGRVIFKKKFKFRLQDQTNNNTCGQSGKSHQETEGIAKIYSGSPMYSLSTSR